MITHATLLIPIIMARLIVKLCLPRKRAADKPVEFQQWNWNGWKIFGLKGLVDFLECTPLTACVDHNCWYGMEQIRGPWYEGFKASPALLMIWKPEPYLSPTHTHTHTPTHTYGFCLPLLLNSLPAIERGMSRIRHCTVMIDLLKKNHAASTFTHHASRLHKSGVL